MVKVLCFFLFFTSCVWAQPTLEDYSNKVNVFLGSSGDYGQLSPAASYPFSMLSIGPKTYPYNHTGYEYRAKTFEGFTHTRLEGVGCKGSGGNLLIKPILGADVNTQLYKIREEGTPGYYGVRFSNGVEASFAVTHNYGIHRYLFPDKANLYVDLSASSVDRFLSEDHEIGAHSISGTIRTRTTCDAGVYQIYYYLDFGEGSKVEKIGSHQFIVSYASSEAVVRVGMSSVDTSYARDRIVTDTFEQTRLKAKKKWNALLGRIRIEDDSNEKVALFYSLLYRTLQAPFLISESDGCYRTISGEKKVADFNVYHGWAIWDNYRELFPLFSLFYPLHYRDMTLSIANLYPYGKKDFATLSEPAPTVRTEHAMVVLLDAIRKGVPIPVSSIKDYLLREAAALRFDSADKALESSYDLWALGELLKQIGCFDQAAIYTAKAKEYKKYWLKDFADLTRLDVDQMQARGLYQGTIWQYRWLVPYDVQGLVDLIGSEHDFITQLDAFFEGDYYNHANQPDLQVPGLYNASSQPWKSQKLYHELLEGEVVQFYFNDNSKGVDPYIGKIYKNQPQAFLRTMDDDMGTMSAWFVLRSLGFSAANVGEPYFYLTAPLFSKVTIQKENGQQLKLENKNKQVYIQGISIDRNEWPRNYLNYKEFLNTQKIQFHTGSTPKKNWPSQAVWRSSLSQ